MTGATCVSVRAHQEVTSSSFVPCERVLDRNRNLPIGARLSGGCIRKVSQWTLTSAPAKYSWLSKLLSILYIYHHTAWLEINCNSDTWTKRLSWSILPLMCILYCDLNFAEVCSYRIHPFIDMKKERNSKLPRYPTIYCVILRAKCCYSTPFQVMFTLLKMAAITVHVRFLIPVSWPLSVRKCSALQMKRATDVCRPMGWSTHPEKVTCTIVTDVVVWRCLTVTFCRPAQRKRVRLNLKRFPMKARRTTTKTMIKLT